MVIRNEAFSVFLQAFDNSNLPLDNAASSITANLYQDDSPTPTSLGNPVNIEANIYRYNLTSSQMDANSIAIVPTVTGGVANTIFILTERGKLTQLATGSTALGNSIPDLYDEGTVTQVTDGSRFRGNSELNDQDGFYNDMYLIFLTGPLKGMNRAISNYIGADREFVFDSVVFGMTGLPEFPDSPAVGNEFVLMGRFI